jgi:hypothetical protein
MVSVNHFECPLILELNQSVNIFIRRMNSSKCSQKIDLTKNILLCLVLLFMSVLVKHEETLLQNWQEAGESRMYFPPSDNFSTKCYTN